MEKWSICRLWWRQVKPVYIIYLVSVVKIIKGGNDIVSDGLSWIGTEFFESRGVDWVFLSFAYVKEGVYRHMPLSLLNSLMTRSGFEPNFLMVDLCCEVRLSLVTCGGGLGIRFCVFSRNSVMLVEFGSDGVQVAGL